MAAWHVSGEIMRRVILALALILVAGCESRKAPPPTTAATPAAAPSSATPATTPPAAKSAPSGADQKAAKPTGADGKDAIHLWQVAVVEKLQPFMKWPDDAPDGISKVAPVVRVTIDRHGRILGAHVVESCGYRSFDTAARKIFKRAGTLPAPPPEMTDDQLTFNMAITFTENPHKEKE